MKIHEYQAKALLKGIGFPVPDGRIVERFEEVSKTAGELGGENFVAKAQVHAGGRGKAGGVKVVQGREALERAVRDLLGKKLMTAQTGAAGKQVNKVLVEKAAPIAKEFYLAALVDRTQSEGIVMVSSAGGVEIEEVARVTPEKVKKLRFDITREFSATQAREVADFLCDRELAQKLAPLVQKLAGTLSSWDALLVEINPLVLTRNQEWFVLDAKIIFDDNGLFRHPDIQQLRDPAEEDPREVEAKRFDLNYVGLSGNIGCMVNGAGLAMATMDVIKLAGGMPANFLDVGGGASAEQVQAAFKIILQDPNVKAILVNIFGGIMKCDVIAEGIIRAAREIRIRVPLVVRLEGTRVKEGRELLANSGIPITRADGLREAAEKVVTLAS